MQVYPDRFLAQIEKALPSVVLVFGDEPQQKIECIDHLRALAVKQGFLERQTLIADSDFDWSLLLDATQSMSLFADKQYIELELPTGKPGAAGAKVLAELAKADFTDLLVLIHGGKIGKDVQNTKWFKSLLGLGFYTPCFPQEGQRLQQWISQCIQRNQLSADPDAIALLADNCEGNLLAARQEIEKLSLIYPNAHLNREHVGNATVDQSRFNVFQLVDSLLSGDIQRGIKILYRLESEGVEPNIVIWALIREWQNLWALKHAMQAGQQPQWQKHRIWQNRQGLYSSALHRLNMDDLAQMQQKLAVADLQFKQSVVSKPYVTLCHLCLLFLPAPLSAMSL
ncbi:DNA polymerase III subunit delta [Alteromonas facilis]|uniref:DNA polymerase III subunit delta n=1 Tax=Alteromonas facilis TaxID=2048004 RepID=UPI000C28413F|nr:DNA polymerase III subunit delta [Alteromonas facilis]